MVMELYNCVSLLACVCPFFWPPYTISSHAGFSTESEHIRRGVALSTKKDTPYSSTRSTSFIISVALDLDDSTVPPSSIIVFFALDHSTARTGFHHTVPHHTLHGVGFLVHSIGKGKVWWVYRINHVMSIVGASIFRDTGMTYDRFL